MSKTLFKCHTCHSLDYRIAGADDLKAICLNCGDWMERRGEVDYSLYIQERKEPNREEISH
jgi:hypothetical protein